MYLKQFLLLGLSWFVNANTLSVRSDAATLQSCATSGYRSVAYFVDWVFLCDNEMCYDRVLTAFRRLPGNIRT
jgi:hypothetical protein